ncbi:MAG: hypothetical protein ACWGSD_17855 [Thermodesulfobacteriota bacterium]
MDVKAHGQLRRPYDGSVNVELMIGAPIPNVWKISDQLYPVTMEACSRMKASRP